MVNIKINEEDLKNLDSFLERVDMKGKTEALAMVKIANALMTAAKVDDTPKKVKRAGE